MTPITSPTSRVGSIDAFSAFDDVDTALRKRSASVSPRKQKATSSSPFVATPVDKENMDPVSQNSPLISDFPTKTWSPSKASQYPGERPFNVPGSSPTKKSILGSREESSLHEDVMPEDSIMTVGGCDGMDDTALSTFSAVPNVDMTEFARLRQNSPSKRFISPSKQLQAENSLQRDEESSSERGCTPSRRAGNADSTTTGGDASPTPKRNRQKIHEDNDTTNLILDFTDQFNTLAASSSSYRFRSPFNQGQSPSKSTSQPNLSSYPSRGRTPSPAKFPLPQQTPSERRQLANLLDFDIPPPPTPRSVPTITARELESLKSEYLSQISSLKASLTGKEAEVCSLKDAVVDAEKRVGETQETLREESGRREAIQSERDEWQRRGLEMENVLREVKEEIMREEREKEEYAQKLEESERKREEAEEKAAEAETRVVGMQSTILDPPNAASPSGKEVEIAVEKVARELHTLYKSKHETKVTALKRSYESRWEKRVKELENKLSEIARENEELRVGKDTTMSGVVPNTPQSRTDDHNEAQRVEEARKSEELKAKLAGLSEELASIKRDNDHLIRELEKERVEKGDLVAAVEEMLTISNSSAGDDAGAASSFEDFRRSISRASGMKPPSQTASSGPGESKIGRLNTHGGSMKLGRSVGTGSSGVSRSGIMSNIERMGRGRVD